MFKFKHSSSAGKPIDRHSPLLCQACHQSPAAFLCKADDASLCAACDSDIHSANPLARRHQRIPIHPSMDGHHDFQLTNHHHHHHPLQADEDQTASWLLPNPQKNNNFISTTSTTSSSVEMLFGGVVDDYSDLDAYNTCQFGSSVQLEPQQLLCYNNGTCVPQKGCPGPPGEDSVVPIHGNRGKKCQVQLDSHHISNARYSLSTTAPTSISQNVVSISSMDVGIVPESAMNDSFVSSQRPAKGTIDLFTGTGSSGCHVQMPPNQLSAEDREARVLRYREKKKMRKFEKTIRYASRKAYAEIRPRIKGRFAKRATDAATENNAYGIVPSLF